MPFAFFSRFAFRRTRCVRHIGSRQMLFFSLLLRLHIDYSTYLVKVDRRLPELLVGLVEVPHTNLTEVTGVVLVNVGPVVVLTTGHTATTGVLAVLANTTVSGRHMATAKRRKKFIVSALHILYISRITLHAISHHVEPDKRGVGRSISLRTDWSQRDFKKGGQKTRLTIFCSCANG